jgi:universal stress protein A
MMTGYQHILLATDFAKCSQRVAQRARDLANLYHARLSLLHVVDNLPIADSVYGPVIPFDVDITDQLVETARKRLRAMADELGIPSDSQTLEVGSPQLEIIRVAEESEVDLIVVGSHGRHGLGLLLGSTANAVLHHAKCDVLAVRLKNDE